MAATVSNLVPISADYLLIADDVTSNGTVSIGKSVLFSDDHFLSDSQGLNVATNKGSSTINGVDHLNSLRIKNNVFIAFKVSKACHIKVYHQSHSSRTVIISSDFALDNGDVIGEYSTTTTEADIEKGQTVYVYTIDSANLGTSGKGDLYIAGIEITMAPEKEVKSTVTTVTGAKIQNVAISDEDANTLASTHSVTVTNEFRYAPAVSITTSTVITYTDETTSSSSENINAEVELNGEGTYYVATATISETAYTINIPVATPATDIVSISEATTWNWEGATSSDIQLTDGNGRNELVYLANYGPWSASFNADALMAKGEYLSRTGYNCFQGSHLFFRTTVPGTVEVYYSNTGTRTEGQERSVKLNGNCIDPTGSLNGTSRKAEGVVAAGNVEIRGYLMSDDTDQYLRIYKVVFTPIPNQPATISAGGYTTFCPLYSDVTIPAGVTAYTAAVNGAGDAVELTAVEGGKLPKGCGVVLAGTAGEAYEFTATTDAAALDVGNQMVGATTDIAALADAYALGVDGSSCFFGKWNGTTFPTGKAYLSYSAAAAPARLVINNGGTTGISEVTNAKGEVRSIFNLAGQKVGSNYKGIVIKNGKKVVVK